MEIQEIYNQFRDYYGELETEYAHCQKTSLEWEILHLRYLIYYLMRYGIGEMKFFNINHYRAAYRWYLQSLMSSSA
ncbi:sigma(X)-activator ComW [Streptococcus cristatus]|uniref:sigma(X)-activator ComW n=1 Tax=Streptococcus cristatus TaxID=45634 RepID=UPI0025929233|nr:sigma(X)-activator ComW [uncultured Streptococcus sp.]